MKKSDKLNMLPKEIKISEKIINSSNKQIIRGIYGVFSVKGNAKKCIYVGRSYNIKERFLSYNGHLTSFWSNSKLIQELKLVPFLINQELEKGNQVSIEILEEVEFKGDNYYKDMQRLASAECRIIDDFQNNDECVKQLPEGNWMKKDSWDSIFLSKTIKINENIIIITFF